MRKIAQLADKGDGPARLAIEMYCYRIKKYIGAYHAVLGNIDALVFTAGIGENAADIRFHACEGLSHLGIKVDAKKNEFNTSGIFEIQSDAGPIKILVIPTDEELAIAEQTVQKIETISNK